METSEDAKQVIVDAPVHVANLNGLPKQGVEGQTYVCDDTRRAYRFDKGQYIQLAPVRVAWSPVEGVFNSMLELIRKARACQWFYFRNPNIHVKYVEIRIDMRSGDCIIKDNRGNVITFEELEAQLPPAIGRPLHRPEVEAQREKQQ